MSTNLERAKQIAQTGVTVDEQQIAIADMETKPYPKLKNRRLAEITRQIAVIGKDMTAKRVDIAKLLGEVSRDKLYTDDGFKSVSEYAESAFGMKSALAYQLAEVGRRFLLEESTSDKVRHITAALPLSTLSELAAMTDEQIETAVDNGELSDNTTQKAARAVANANKTAKPKVLKDYVADIVVVDMHDGAVYTEHLDRVTKEAIVEHIEGKYHFANSAASKVGADTVFILSDTGDFAKVTFAPYVETKTGKGKGKKPDLLEMLKNASAEELAVIKAMFAGND